MSIEILSAPLDVVRINGGTQSRASLNENTVAEYAEAIRNGSKFPPVVMFFDGVDFWLADGFHRYFAHRAAGAAEIEAEIREGTCRAAILHSVGANASHGLRRSNADKRKAVETLLNDAEWVKWSDNQIAKACGVSDKTVAGYRAAIFGISEDARPAARTVERNGTTYQQNTANIGKAKPAADIPRKEGPQPALAEAPAPAVVEMARDALAELHEHIAELQVSLKEAISENEMMGRVFDADDRVKAAMDEAKRQKAIADNAERTLMAKTGEFNERARAVTYWKNRAEKAEKALAKVAA